MLWNVKLADDVARNFSATQPSHNAGRMTKPDILYMLHGLFRSLSRAPANNEVSSLYECLFQLRSRLESFCFGERTRASLPLLLLDLRHRTNHWIAAFTPAANQPPPGRLRLPKRVPDRRQGEDRNKKYTRFGAPFCVARKCSVILLYINLRACLRRLQT